MKVERKLIHAFLGPVLFASSINPVIPPPITPDKLPTPLPIPTATPAAIPEQSKLEKYLEKIKPLQEAYVQIVSEHDVFQGLKKFPTDKRIADAERYFPLYCAAGKEYGINPYLLSIFHVDESSNSRDENPDWEPYPRSGSSRGLIKGAMQRYDRYYPDDLVTEISGGYEFLEELDQRYTKNNGSTVDYQEIIFCAWKLQRDAKTYKDKMWGNGIKISDTEALAKAVETYSAPAIGRNRFKVYQTNKHLFAKLFPESN